MTCAACHMHSDLASYTTNCFLPGRVFGSKFAEMPFVATKAGYRREGNCKRLLKVSLMPHTVHTQPSISCVAAATCAYRLLSDIMSSWIWLNVPVSWLLPFLPRFCRADVQKLLGSGVQRSHDILAVEILHMYIVLSTPRVCRHPNAPTLSPSPKQRTSRKRLSLAVRPHTAAIPLSCLFLQVSASCCINAMWFFIKSLK